MLLLGQYSTGKTTFIKHLLGRDYPGIHIGPEPTTGKKSQAKQEIVKTRKKKSMSLLRQYSTGNITFIKHLLGRDYPSIRVGPELTTGETSTAQHSTAHHSTAQHSTATFNKQLLGCSPESPTEHLARSS